MQGVPGGWGLGWRLGRHASSFFVLHRFLVLSLQLLFFVPRHAVAPGGEPVLNWYG
jgi:hypothetical protein